MSHPNETTLRTAYAAFGAGHPEQYLSYCTEDMTFHVPGKSRLAGDYTKAEFLSTLLPKVMELSGGSFRETVIEVLANDGSGVVLASHELRRGNRELRYDTVHVYRIANGRMASFAEYPADQYAFDDAWH